MACQARTKLARLLFYPSNPLPQHWKAEGMHAWRGHQSAVQGVLMLPRACPTGKSYAQRNSTRLIHPQQTPEEFLIKVRHLVGPRTRIRFCQPWQVYKYLLIPEFVQCKVYSLERISN